MKTITQHITERLQLTKDRVKKHNYEYFPETKQELREIIDEKAINHIDKKEVLDLNMIDTSQITDMESLFINRFDKFANVYKIDISESYAFEISRFINLNKRSQRLIQFNRKIFPTGVTITSK